MTNSNPKEKSFEKDILNPLHSMYGELEQIKGFWEDLNLLNKETTGYYNDFVELLDLTDSLRSEYAGLYAKILIENKELEQIIQNKDSIKKLIYSNILVSDTNISQNDAKKLTEKLFDVLYCEGCLSK